MTAPGKGNASEQAGVCVAGGQAKATKQGVLAQSTHGVGQAQGLLVLALLRQGAKTTIDLRMHGVLMPATRVFEPKKAGHHIQTELIPLFDLHGFKHANCARYRLVQEAGAEEAA